MNIGNQVEISAGTPNVAPTSSNSLRRAVVAVGMGMAALINNSCATSPSGGGGDTVPAGTVFPSIACENPVDVEFYGDSITSGINGITAYPELFEPKERVTNFGWAGQGIKAINALASKNAADPNCVPVEKTLSILGGLNDVVYFHQSAPQEAAILDQFIGTRILEGMDIENIVVILPTPVRATGVQNTLNAYEQLVTAKYPDNVVDCNPVLKDADGLLKREYSVAYDQFHLNDLGERALAECIAPRFPSLILVPAS